MLLFSKSSLIEYALIILRNIMYIENGVSTFMLMNSIFFQTSKYLILSLGLSVYGLSEMAFELFSSLKTRNFRRMINSWQARRDVILYGQLSSLRILFRVYSICYFSSLIILLSTNKLESYQLMLTYLYTYRIGTTHHFLHIYQTQFQHIQIILSFLYLLFN